jgi:hypothetical protein
MKISTHRDDSRQSHVRRAEVEELKRFLPMEECLRRLGATSKNGRWHCPCPSRHNNRDGDPSVSIEANLATCWSQSCFKSADIFGVIGAVKELKTFPQQLQAVRELVGAQTDPDADKACTLENYARLKHLDLSLLKEYGLHDEKWKGSPAIEIPYKDVEDKTVTPRYRISLTEKNGFRWAAGKEPKPYGLWRLEETRRQNSVIIVEGESDCHTLWQNSIAAFGVPGAGAWKREWGSYLDGIEQVFVVQEPDRGGADFVRNIAKKSPGLVQRIRVIRFEGIGLKDPSALHIKIKSTGGNFKEEWDRLVGQAAPYTSEGFSSFADSAHLHTPPSLAQEPNILAAFEKAVRACGVVGEERNAKLIYLAVTSRILDEPVSLVLKGLSSSGKSFTTETVLKFFPKAAYISMTAMSERALIYMKEDFKHKTLVIFEAVALREQRDKNESNLTAYFVRSLLSEGRISYPVTVRDKNEGFVTKIIVKEGPTNVILTTTATELHGENETRMLSLPTNDTQEQTKAVMRRLAENGSRASINEEWHQLQSWLMDAAGHDVVVPYAAYLAEKIPPVAVRLRRDFKAVLRLIETHAILHQSTRPRDQDGRIVANRDDYLAMRGLVADLIASGVGATVSQTIRQTVNAVSEINQSKEDKEVKGATVREVALRLKLDRSATQRRIQAARDRGHLVNLEEKRGQPARYAIGDPLPEELELLPLDVPEESEGMCRCATTAKG